MPSVIDRWMNRSVQKGTRATNYLLTIVDGDLTSNRIIVVGLWHGEGELRERGKDWLGMRRRESVQAAGNMSSCREPADSCVQIQSAYRDRISSSMEERTVAVPDFFLLGRA